MNMRSLTVVSIFLSFDLHVLYSYSCMVGYFGILILRSDLFIVDFDLDICCSYFDDLIVEFVWVYSNSSSATNLILHEPMLLCFWLHGAVLM